MRAGPLSPYVKAGAQNAQTPLAYMNLQQVPCACVPFFSHAAYASQL